MSVYGGQAEKGINSVKNNIYLTRYVAGVLQHKNLSLGPTRAGLGSQEAGQKSVQEPVHSLLCKSTSDTEKNLFPYFV